MASFGACALAGPRSLPVAGGSDKLWDGGEATGRRVIRSGREERDDRTNRGAD